MARWTEHGAVDESQDREVRANSERKRHDCTEHWDWRGCQRTGSRQHIATKLHQHGADSSTGMDGGGGHSSHVTDLS